MKSAKHFKTIKVCSTEEAQFTAVTGINNNRQCCKM